MWSLLFVTLPTRPNTVRMRIWRSLKSLGCVALRDGAYVLPQSQEALFEPIADEVQTHGGTAMQLRLSPTNDEQRREVMALFDRGEAYAQWHKEAQALLDELGSLAELEARRHWRNVTQALEHIRRIDYYPGAAAEQAQAMLAALRSSIDARFSKGEPAASKGHGIVRLDARKFQAKTWATRARPWADRLASAWLIGRFIDTKARFVWLAETSRLPKGALGFDFDGARFSHVGVRVTFEVLAASFGLEQDPRLQRIAAAVRYLDVGGIPVPEAAGLEAVLAGLKQQHQNDDQLLAAAAAVFDALLLAPTGAQREPA